MGNKANRKQVARLAARVASHTPRGGTEPTQRGKLHATHKPGAVPGRKGRK